MERMDTSLETLLQKRVDGLLLMCTEARAPSSEVLNVITIAYDDRLVSFIWIQ